MSIRKDQYFAQAEPDELVSYLEKRSQSWFQTLSDNSYLETIERSWEAYHGRYYEKNHDISMGGEQGELVNLAVNHYGNIAQNMLTMVTSTRPSFQARAVNTDYKSQAQTTLANGLLEYYMRDKRLEQDLKKAVEYAIVMGTGYIKMEWSSTSGNIHDYTEDTTDPVTGETIPGLPMYDGDMEFHVLSPYDVVFDTTKESTKHDWQICRSFKNKFDLAAKYPELADDIKEVRTKSDNSSRRITMTSFDETCDVPVYEFFHRPTESLPKGRYVIYLNKDTILVDTDLPYRKLPIFRIAPRDLLGSAYGYSTMWDLLSIQKQINALYSTIATNQHTFGVQNIYAQRDANISMSELAGGLNLIEGDPGSAPPQPLNLTQTPGEIFTFLGMLERAMETISGINSVARGNPDPKQNLRSGNALALVQSQALQFISGLQQSYIHLIEDVGTNIIFLLQDYAEVPRIAEIAGKSSSSLMQEFTGEDLSSIHRVIVDAGNALSQTTAGKLEIAGTLMQMGLIKTPEDYFSVMNTGKLETMTEGMNKELLTIRAENEQLFSGETEVMAILTDEHLLHIKQHKAVLADPKLRLDPELVDRVLGHIQEHMNLLTDPNVAMQLQALGQTPMQLPPPPMDPNAAPSATGPDGMPLQANAPANDPGLQAQMAPELPQPAQPATSPDGAPTTAQEAFNNQIGQR
jgi:hypothetical protein